MGDKSKDEVRYDFTPWDGTPGPLYDIFDTALMNCASRSDDRGWSFADWPWSRFLEIPLEI